MFFAMIVLAAQAAVQAGAPPLEVVSVHVTVEGRDYPVRMTAAERYRIRRDVPFTMTLVVRLAEGAQNPCPAMDSGCSLASELILTGWDGSMNTREGEIAETDDVSFERGYTFSFVTGPTTVPANLPVAEGAALEWRFNKLGNEFFVYRLALEFR